MTYWQILQQIRYLLQQRHWDADGANPVVFDTDSVVVVAGDGDLDAIDSRLILPACLIIASSGQNDPEAMDEPLSVHRRLSTLIIARNENDKMGTAAVMGAGRQGAGDSRGRGVLELEPQVKQTIAALTATYGVNVVERGAEEPATRREQDDNAYALQELIFEAVCASTLYYAPGRLLAAHPYTGQVSLTWQLPATRFDSYRARLIRKTGSTAPSSPTDGIEVTLSGNWVTSAVDTLLVSGTYSYSLFISYDDMSTTPVSDLRTSAACSVAGVVVP